jgi:hypothetical protein
MGITIIITIAISIVPVRANISFPIHQNIDSAAIEINKSDLDMEKWSLFHHSIIRSFHHSVIPSFRDGKTNDFNQSNFIQYYPFNS